MSRAISTDLPSGEIQLISLEDAVAREARLLLDLHEGTSVPAKHVHDYLRLCEVAQLHNKVDKIYEEMQAQFDRVQKQNGGAASAALGTRK